MTVMPKEGLPLWEFSELMLMLPAFPRIRPIFGLPKDRHFVPCFLYSFMMSFTPRSPLRPVISFVNL